jgi:hypothetical protein
MKKGKDRSADTSKSVRHARTLRIAMAAASLGMCIGISPGDVLAVSAQREPIKDSFNTEPQQLAAAFLKFDGVDGESKTDSIPTRPGRSIQKAEQPGASFQKVEQPAASFQKVEQPAVVPQGRNRGPRSPRSSSRQPRSPRSTDRGLRSPRSSSRQPRSPKSIDRGLRSPRSSTEQ